MSVARLEVVAGDKKSSVIDDMVFTVDGNLRPGAPLKPARRRMPENVAVVSGLGLPAGWPTEHTPIQWSPAGKVTAVVCRRQRDGRGALIYSLDGAIDDEGARLVADLVGVDTGLAKAASMVPCDRDRCCDGRRGLCWLMTNFYWQAANVELLWTQDSHERRHANPSAARFHMPVLGYVEQEAMRAKALLTQMRRRGISSLNAWLGVQAPQADQWQTSAGENEQ